MTPSFPIVLPQGACVIVLDHEVECSMLRLEQPCGNSTDIAILYPSEGGRIGLLGYCVMCIEEQPDDWCKELEQMQKRNMGRLAAVFGAEL